MYALCYKLIFSALCSNNSVVCAAYFSAVSNCRTFAGYNWRYGSTLFRLYSDQDIANSILIYELRTPDFFVPDFSLPELDLLLNVVCTGQLIKLFVFLLYIMCTHQPQVCYFKKILIKYIVNMESMAEFLACSSPVLGGVRPTRTAQMSTPCLNWTLGWSY